MSIVYKVFPNILRSASSIPLLMRTKNWTLEHFWRGVLLGLAPGKIPTYCMSPLTVTISLCDTLKNVTSVDCEAGIHRLQIPLRSAQRQSLFDDNIVRDESGQPVQWLETPQRQQPVEPEED
jgi:hypothetical protein